MEIILALLLIGGIWFFFGVKSDPKLDEAAKFRDTYRGWDHYVSSFDGAVLATNRDKGRIVLGTLAFNVDRDLAKLTSVSIEKDGQGITVANRGSQAMGAAVGGVLLGPMGFLVGGLSGSKTKKERVNHLALKIVIDDPDRPVHRIVFFDVGGAGVDAKDSRLKKTAEQLEHQYAILSNAIREQTKNASPLPNQPDSQQLEDRIEKLWRLKETGAINVEEFEQQKARLLG